MHSCSTNQSYKLQYNKYKILNIQNIKFTINKCYLLCVRGEVTRNILRCKEYTYVDSMHRRTNLHVYFIRITIYVYILHYIAYL